MSIVLNILEKYQLSYKLVKSGKEALLRCPFKKHNDRTPSLYIEVSTGRFHCFACLTGGPNMEVFVEKLTGEKISLESMVTPGEQFQFMMNQIYERSENNILGTMRTHYRNEEIKGLFESFDDVSLHSEAMDYLTGPKRKLSPEIIKAFDLRFCTFGEYKNRIAVPYYRGDKLIGFNARLLGTDKQIGKELRYRYVLNQTEFADYIYNIEFTKGDFCILVEGPFDLMWMVQCGFKNVISTLSTRISAEHIAHLSKFQKFIFVFDNDEKKSGEIAMMKAAKDILNLLQYRQVYACKLPDFKDPNECTPEELKESLRILKQIRLEEKHKSSFERMLE